MMDARELLAVHGLPRTGEEHWRRADPKLLAGLQELLATGASGPGVDLDPADFAGDLRIAWINHALHARGARVRVPAGESAPLQVLAAAQGAATATHVVSLEADAQATVVELHDDADAAPVLSSQVRIELAAHSRLVHLRIVSPRHAGAIADSVLADVHEGARYEQYTLLAPAAALRSTQAVRLAGRDAEARLQAGVVARERGAVDLRVEVTHLADGTSSEQHVHALGAGGRTTVDSEVVVPAGRRAIRSRQALRGLHVAGAQDLSLRPRLAVRAEGVDCRHGATTCAVDPEQLHFLRSRGIGHGEALRLLAHAHLLQVLAPSSGGGLLRSHLDAALAGIAA